MSNDVLVFAEVRDGVFKGITRELITAAAELAGKTGGVVSVVVVGGAIDAAVEEAKSYPVSTSAANWEFRGWPSGNTSKS